MDHKEAINGQLAERYLLGELQPAERDQFEEHFFDCQICSDDVESGATFIDNARTILRAEEIPSQGRLKFAKFGLPFQTAAIAATFLTFLVAYQNVITIPAMRAGGGSRVAEVVAPVSLIGMDSRAEAKPVSLAAGKDALFQLEVPGDASFDAYSFQLQDATGGVRVNLPISPEKAKNVVILSIPSSSLPRGEYRMEVYGERAGQPEKELSRYRAFVQ